VRDILSHCQVKRIHEYKRQLLNALRIVVLYNRVRENPNIDVTPRTFFFAGKAAPAYQLAKLIIKLINNLAGTIDGDPAMRGRLKVVFLPEYDESLAERLIPASDVSNQISTAGYEASGTSNMKFMMNGALTLGTRDGATIEMAEEAGEEHFFLFGLTAAQVADSRGWYNPHWHYDHEPETREVLDLIFSDDFSRYEASVFAPLRDTLLTQGDHYMHLADLRLYLEADHRSIELYGDAPGWARKAILNVAGSGEFSSDRTIAECAAGHLECEALSGALEQRPLVKERMETHGDFSLSRQASPQRHVGRPGPARTRVLRMPARHGRPQPTGQLRHQRPPGLTAARLIHRGPYSGHHPGHLRLSAQPGH
jgi:starch phosphorylase